MPFGDRTGPNGLGPMTGRRAGYCTGNTAPGYATLAIGRGFYGRGAGFGRGVGWGFGRGFGRGFRRGFYATGVPGRAYGAYGPYAVPYAQPQQPLEADAKKQEKIALEQEASALEQELAKIKKRLAELQK